MSILDSQNPQVQDEFLTNDLFIRLSWSLYFQTSGSSHLVETQYYKDVENLINITNLNKQTLMHTLYYLFLLVQHKPFLYESSNYKLPSNFQSSSRNKLLSSRNRKNSNELFELIVILFMISNKANDDSSYTLKTWSNLTPLTNNILKKKEFIVLKKIQYNVFLKNEEYNNWTVQLYELGLKYNLIWDANNQIMDRSSCSTVPTITTACSTTSPHPSLLNYPLTPKSPAQEISYQNLQPLPQMIPQQQQFPLPNLYSAPVAPPVSNKRTAAYSMGYQYSPYKKPQYDYFHTPSFKYQAQQPQAQVQAQVQAQQSLLLTPLKSGYNEQQHPYYESEYYPQPVYQQNYPVYLSEDYYMNSNNNADYIPQQCVVQAPHPSNCACCALTNMTNSYHSSLKSMVKL